MWQYGGTRIHTAGIPGVPNQSEGERTMINHTTQRIFLAGASGAIGRRLAPLLVANGWPVFGSTRSKSKVDQLAELGVEPMVVDVYDAANLQQLLTEIRP